MRRTPRLDRMAVALLVLLAQPATSAEPEAADAAEQAAPAAGEDEASTGSQPDAPAPAAVVRQLGEVTATAARAERDNLEVPGNVTVITRDDIERSGARDVPDLLRREAGLFVTQDNTNPEGYRVEARGFNNGGGNGSGTLVLIDGRRANEPTSSVADWALLRMDQVESIEIVRGPASALYGDSAEGGVIHITTRQGRGAPRFELRGRSGTYDTDTASLFAGGTSGPVTASLFLDGYHTDGYRDRSDFRSHEGDLRLEFDLGERATLSVRGGYSSSRRKRPGDLSKAEMDVDRRQAEPGSGENLDRVRVRFAEGQIELFPHEDVTVKVQGWWRRRTDDVVITDPFSAFEGDTRARSAGLNSQIEIDRELLGRPHRLVFGADGLREKVNSDSIFDFFAFPPPSVADTTARRYLYGFFLQDELELADGLILSGGLRYDRWVRRGRDRRAGRKFTARQTAWSPKAALTYRILPPLSAYASWARGFRSPNTDEAFGFFGFAPLLRQEKSESYEIGLKLRSERARANLAAYTMNVRDEIFFDPFAPNPMTGFDGRNTNLDRTRHRGVEFWVSVRPWERLEVYGSFTYDDVKVTRDTVSTPSLEGSRLPITPRYRGDAGVRVTLPYWIELGFNGIYVGSRYLANDVLNENEKLPKFARYDAHLGFRPPRIFERVELAFTAAVRNVFGRRYTEFGALSVFSPRVGFFPSPERNYEVGMSITVRR